MRPLVILTVMLIILFFVGATRANSILLDPDTPSFLQYLERFGERVAHDALELMTPLNALLLASIPILTLLGISADSSWFFSTQQKQITAGEAYATMKANLRVGELLHTFPDGHIVVTSAKRTNGTRMSTPDAIMMVHDSRYSLRSRARHIREYRAQMKELAMNQ